MAAPANAELATGQYDGAERFPFQSADRPGLNLSGQGRGCNTLAGSFEIYEVAYDGAGKVTALNASVVQHYEGGAAALRGTIAFNTVPPMGVTAIGLNSYHLHCKNLTTGQKIAQQTSGPTYDCRKLGLMVNPDDQVQVRIWGNAL